MADGKLTLYIACADCGTDLNAEVLACHLYVKPCPECLKEARPRGRENATEGIESAQESGD